MKNAFYIFFKRHMVNHYVTANDDKMEMETYFKTLLVPNDGFSICIMKQRKAQTAFSHNPSCVRTSRVLMFSFPHFTFDLFYSCVIKRVPGVVLAGQDSGRVMSPFQRAPVIHYPTQLVALCLQSNHRVWTR